MKYLKCVLKYNTGVNAPNSTTQCITVNWREYFSTKLFLEFYSVHHGEAIQLIPVLWYCSKSLSYNFHCEHSISVPESLGNNTQDCILVLLLVEAGSAQFDRKSMDYL